MKGKTYVQVLAASWRSGSVVEQIALRSITLRIGGVRWTFRLRNDGLWRCAP